MTQPGITEELCTIRNDIEENKEHLKALEEGGLGNISGFRPSVRGSFHALNSLPQLPGVAGDLGVILAERFGVHGVLEQLLNFFVRRPDVAQPDFAVTARADGFGHFRSPSC